MIRKIIAMPFLAMILIYRYVISPAFGMHNICRYKPTCSQYCYDAIKKYGVIKGGIMGLKRIGRCNPKGGSGYDPVP